MRTCLALAACVTLAGGCACPRGDRDLLFQHSILNALMAGVYDGELACGELRARGDTGIGTFDGLDGEMVMLEGTVYPVNADGSGRVAGDSERTPFAQGTFFEPDIEAPVERPMEMGELQAFLDGLLPDRNSFCAILIEGAFNEVKVRSVPRQREPYPPLAEAVRGQAVFDLGAVRGTIVGFRYPGTLRGSTCPATISTSSRRTAPRAAICSAAASRGEPPCSTRPRGSSSPCPGGAASVTQT